MNNGNYTDQKDNTLKKTKDSLLYNAIKALNIYRTATGTPAVLLDIDGAPVNDDQKENKQNPVGIFALP